MRMRMRFEMTIQTSLARCQIQILETFLRLRVCMLELNQTNSHFFFLVFHIDLVSGNL